MLEVLSYCYYHLKLENTAIYSWCPFNRPQKSIRPRIFKKPQLTEEGKPIPSHYLYEKYNTVPVRAEVESTVTT